MIFKLDIKKTLLDILCSLLKKIKDDNNRNSGGNNIIKNTVNGINIGGSNIKININFIITDKLSEIIKFDTTIEKSIKFTTDDISLWLYCNTNNDDECFALGKYLISSNYDSDKMALWIGLHTGSHSESDPSDKSILKKNLMLIIEFLGKGWNKKNMVNVAKKEKGDEHYYVDIERFEEKSPEELLTFIKTKLEEASKDKE